MATYTVTVVDTAGIQPYIFGSNRLQENIGASELVRLAAEQWALETVIAVAEQHNVLNAVKKDLSQPFEIDKAASEKAAEVIYAGGGNTVVIFSGAELAREFAGKLTRKVHQCATGLSLVVAHDHEFIWNEPPGNERALSQVVKKLIGQTLAARKAARLPSQPPPGLSVTASCESTGLPAMRTNEGRFSPSSEYRPVRLKLKDGEPTRLISREVACKLWARDLANRRLKSQFERELSDWYVFPSDMDNLGRISGEESYVAVVHADGNGMGKRIEGIADAHPNAAQNREYIKKMRQFSNDVETAALAALRRMVKLLTERITWEQGREIVAERVPMEGTYLPFRPLVFGGDDVTFVCNGQLGVSLAVEYLKNYEDETKNSVNPDLKGLHASAGIAIVKMHYPFARAYVLSESLAREAKKHVWKEVSEKYGPEKSASALDWHIATSGLSGSLEEIRRREYRSAKDRARTLLMRPVLLRPGESTQDARTWFDGIERLTLEFQRGEAWADSRNRVKLLRDILREGLDGDTTKIEIRLQSYDLQLPAIISGSTLYQQHGWHGDRCGYFDAVELSDYYLHLPFDDEGAP
jgi:hypothetical protein